MDQKISPESVKQCMLSACDSEHSERLDPQLQLLSVPGQSYTRVEMLNEDAWTDLCFRHGLHKKYEVPPSAIVNSSGIIQIKAQAAADYETLLRLILEENMHLQLGFPNESGMSEFCTKLYREGIMRLLGYPALSAEEVLGEVIAFYAQDFVQIRRALGSASMLVQDLDLSVAHRCAERLREEVGLEPLGDQSQPSYENVPSCEEAELAESAPIAASLFKSKEERMLLRQISNRQNMSRLKRMMLENDKQIQLSAERAAAAKDVGAQEKYVMERNLLKKALCVGTLMNRLTTTLEGAMLSSKQAESMAVFSATVDIISRQITTISKSVNPIKVLMNWMKAIAKGKDLEDRMESVLSQMEVLAGDDISIDSSGLDEEADRMIDALCNGKSPLKKRGVEDLRKELVSLRDEGIAKT